MHSCLPQINRPTHSCDTYSANSVLLLVNALLGIINLRALFCLTKHHRPLRVHITTPSHHATFRGPVPHTHARNQSRDFHGNATIPDIKSEQYHRKEKREWHHMPRCLHIPHSAEKMCQSRNNNSSCFSSPACNEYRSDRRGDFLTQRQNATTHSPASSHTAPGTHLEVSQRFCLAATTLSFSSHR